MKVYFDTNIWVDFFLIEELGSTFLPKRLERSQELQKLSKENKFTLCSTIWSLYEFRDVFEKLKINKKLIALGYNLIDFREGEKENPLNNKERNALNESVGEIEIMTDMENVELNADILTLLLRAGISTFDAILLFCSNKLNCDYFVTRDKTLITKMKHNKDLKKLINRVEVMHRNSFITLIKHDNI